MLDYDGTLAPFQVDRFEARPYPGVEDQLVTLSALPRVRLVLVTGRSARELRDLLHPGIQAEISGNHGWEWLRADGSYERVPLDPPQQKALEQVGLEMSALGFASSLEVKPSSLAIHWRSLDDYAQERVRSSAESVFARLSDPGGLHLMSFDGGVELRSTDRTKGTAVAEILAQEPSMVPAAYLGDDFTDEDAFAVMGTRGYSILVRAVARPSHASLWLRPPQELSEFLDDWIAAISQSPAAIAEASR
jgi:trehalose 6-phosphate phosphatase